MQWHRIELRNVKEITEFNKNNSMDEKEINIELPIEAF